ncbi:MAG: hypothetical protein GY796_16635 [Chloroflexi bacterium]|nr:hypothetical protein [Chloroflexota bacterium]
MQLNELMQTVQYVTDNQGNRQSVLLDLDIWQAMIHHLDMIAENHVDVDRQTAIKREEAAYQTMYKELYAKYPGEHVAIYQEGLVDHDEDGSKLYKRVRQKYPGKFVLITPVSLEAEETYRILSPRLAVKE